MNILRKAGTTAALTVAGAGIAVGAVGLAAAEDTTTEQDSSTTIDRAAGEGRGHGNGPGGRDGRGGSGELASGLAEALGLEESDVADALSAVHDQREAGDSGEREERRAELASALADELDVSEESVTEALASLTSERAAAGRSALADRLDAAVAEGTLTEADKESVLKAFDAGVLGGGGRGHGPQTS